MDFELITFPICPYGQRSAITLLHKEVPHRVTYIEPGGARPEWFAALSPLGKVPLLRIDGEVGIFESAVINELVDELTPGRMLPEDPIRRARARAWIEFGSACLMDLFLGGVAATEEAALPYKEGLLGKLQHLEAALGEGPYFDGEAVSLVDTTYAPLFVRLDLMARRYGYLDLEATPKVAAWSAALLELPAVKGSTPDNLEALYAQMFEARGSHLA